MFSQCETSNAVFYIHSLAPKTIQVFYSLINCVKSGQSLSNEKVESILTILACLEVFIEKAAEDKRKWTCFKLSCRVHALTKPYDETSVCRC